MPEQGQRLTDWHPIRGYIQRIPTISFIPFAAQVKYYTEYAAAHPEYELVDIYADEAVHRHTKWTSGMI